MLFKFEDLKVYQKSLDFIDGVYKITLQFPQEELYGLTSQFRRASTSIALNIAEGSGSTDKDFNKYLRTAFNSLKECVVCSTLAFRLKFINKEVYDNLRKELAEISKMIAGLRKYLNQRQQ
ncbi:four helix bundle protein [Salinimicrobium sp. TIG7-5_MAKvit]|uniref:four helix bundle protein n=1 Tax=Salinimicrobium sp. TIG7-5_MAKvit TaxID=3121289 RepID=UPI003C6E9A9E